MCEEVLTRGLDNAMVGAGCKKAVASSTRMRGARTRCTLKLKEALIICAVSGKY
jgi:hypothetical protein